MRSGYSSLRETREKLAIERKLYVFLKPRWVFVADEFSSTTIGDGSWLSLWPLVFVYV